MEGATINLTGKSKAKVCGSLLNNWRRRKTKKEVFIGSLSRPALRIRNNLMRIRFEGYLLGKFIS
jgi:hypothetical protein